MHVVPVFDPDLEWEDDAERFRVRFHLHNDGSAARPTTTYDITGADVLEVIVWAQQHAGEHQTYDVALVRQDLDGPALVRLFSTDDDRLSSADPDLADQQHPRLHLVKEGEEAAQTEPAETSEP